MRIHFQKGPVDWRVPTVNPEAPVLLSGRCQASETVVGGIN
jgi:hypothetical protein